MEHKPEMHKELVQKYAQKKRKNLVSRFNIVLP